MKRSRKITLGEMRASGVRGLLICCSDYRTSGQIFIGINRAPLHLCWLFVPDELSAFASKKPND
jgi:hypothetical protein